MEEQLVDCSSPHYEPHGKPMNNIKFLTNKKLTCKKYFCYICSIFDHKVFDVAEAQYCIWLMVDLEIYIWRDQIKNNLLYLFTRMELNLGVRWGGSVVGYVRWLRSLALLLLNHLRDFFLGVCVTLMYISIIFIVCIIVSNSIVNTINKYTR